MTFLGSDIRLSALVGAAARLGGVVKRRPRSHRPPPSNLAPAGRPVPLTNMSADQVATYASMLVCSRYAGSTQHDMKSAQLPCMLQVAEVMADAHARDVIIVDVGHSCDFADSMVIATGAVWACLSGLAHCTMCIVMYHAACGCNMQH